MRRILFGVLMAAIVALCSGMPVICRRRNGQRLEGVRDALCLAYRH